MYLNRKIKKIIKKLIVYIVVIGILTLSVYLTYKNVFFPKKYETLVNEAARTYNVDPYLLFALIKGESNFNADAISRSNAKGLMQIMEQTANEMVRDINTIPNTNYDIYDPYTNITIGTKYISELILKYDGNIYIALTAYNAGMGNVSTWFGEDYSVYNSIEKVSEKIEFSETKSYVVNIVKYYEIYKKLYQ